MTNLILIAAASSAALVFLKAIQQQNVVGAHYAAAVATSYALGFAELYLIHAAAQAGAAWPVALAIGTGGALGVTAAMRAHPHLVTRRPAAIRAAATPTDGPRDTLHRQAQRRAEAR